MHKMASIDAQLRSPSRNTNKTPSHFLRQVQAGQKTTRDQFSPTPAIYLVVCFVMEQRFVPSDGTASADRHTKNHRTCDLRAMHSDRSG